MYCPACGVKNDGSPLKCFICGSIMPTGQASADRASSGGNSRARSRTSNGNGSIVSPGESLAAIGDRMLALLLDRVVIVALLAIPTALAIEHWSRLDKSWTVPLRVLSVAAAAVLVTALLYHIVLEALFGATLGKGLLGLSVRNGSGEKWLAASIRNVARLIDAVVLYSLAFLFAAFSSKRQRIGDLLAGTVVVEQPVAWGARLALLFILVAVIGGSLWIANLLCPSCLPAASRLLR